MIWDESCRRTGRPKWGTDHRSRSDGEFLEKMNEWKGHAILSREGNKENQGRKVWVCLMSESERKHVMGQWLKKLWVPTYSILWIYTLQNDILIWRNVIFVEALTLYHNHLIVLLICFCNYSNLIYSLADLILKER